MWGIVLRARAVGTERGLPSRLFVRGKILGAFMFLHIYGENELPCRAHARAGREIGSRTPAG